MNDKFSVKNPDDPKIKLEELISFQEKENPLDSPRKAKHENPDNSGLLSKYRKVLSCSFVNGTTGAALVERIGTEKGRFS